jgi:hypothetical protein
MDIQPIDVPPLPEFLSHTRTAHGVDPSHTCNTRTCHYWCSARLPHVFVCKTSLHVHRCGKKCSMSTQMTRGAYVCPISGIEREQEYVAYASRETTRGVERFVNTITWRGTGKKRRHRKKPRPKPNCPAETVRSQLTLFVRSTHQQTTLPTAHALKSQPFQRIITTLFKEAAINTVEPPSDLCTSISKYITRIMPLVHPTPTVMTLVAVTFAFLSTGLVLNGVMVFPKHAWCETHAIKLTSFSKVVGVQCRAMSTATRAWKKSATKGGSIAACFIFT